MPNNTDGTASLAGWRELALVGHALPSAEIAVSFRDGRRFRIGNDAGCLMSPCLFRRAVGAELVERGSVGWLASVAQVSLCSPRCRDLGAGLYGAWCAGSVVHAFTTGIDLAVLVAAVEALPSCDTAVRVIPDELLGLHLVTVESSTATTGVDAADLAREVQATVLVAELELALRVA